MWLNLRMQDANYYKGKIFIGWCWICNTFMASTLYSALMAIPKKSSYISLTSWDLDGGLLLRKRSVDLGLLALGPRLVTYNDRFQDPFVFRDSVEKILLICMCIHFSFYIVRVFQKAAHRKFHESKYRYECNWLASSEFLAKNTWIEMQALIYTNANICKFLYTPICI